MMINEMIEKTAVISPAATLKEAADKMTVLGCAVLSVGTAKGVQGTITDRDIVVSAISQGKDPSREKVRDHMSRRVIVSDGGEDMRDRVCFSG